MTEFLVIEYTHSGGIERILLQPQMLKMLGYR